LKQLLVLVLPILSKSIVNNPESGLTFSKLPREMIGRSVILGKSEENI